MAHARLIHRGNADNEPYRSRPQDPELLRLGFDAIIADHPEPRKVELRRRLMSETERRFPLLDGPWPHFEDETLEHVRLLQTSVAICDSLVPTPMSPPMARSLDHGPIARVRVCL